VLGWPRREGRAEHLSVPLSLLSSRAGTRRDWNSVRVLLVGSAGDPISPLS
jgi:hypothetical protein